MNAVFLLTKLQEKILFKSNFAKVLALKFGIDLHQMLVNGYINKRYYSSDGDVLSYDVSYYIHSTFFSPLSEHACYFLDCSSWKSSSFSWMVVTFIYESERKSGKRDKLGKEKMMVNAII